MNRDIRIAENSGFCFGVKRAMNMISEVSDTYKGRHIYTLGPIIHNPQTVQKLKSEGIDVLKDINDIDRGVVILRTHGVEKEILEQLREKDVTIIDAICPFVRRAQDYVTKLHNENYPVIVIGEINHPEVKALKSQAKDNVWVIQNVDDLEQLRSIKSDSVGIVSQTTQDQEHFKAMIMEIFNYFKEMRIYNTICNATSLRQQSAVNLARDVDVMFIVGGFNSANTKRLYELCSRILPETYHIETKDNITENMIKEKTGRIGIAAGASTPDWIIEEVKEYLKKI